MLFHFNLQSSHSFATNNMQLSQCSLEMFRNLPREVINVKHPTPSDQNMLNNEDEIFTLSSVELFPPSPQIGPA